MGGDWTGARSSDNSDLAHYSLAAVAIIARYSTTVEERAIVRCFVELQEIGLAPRKMRKVPVEVRSSWLPAQFASKKPCNVMGVFRRSRIPKDFVPLRKRSRRLTTPHNDVWMAHA